MEAGGDDDEQVVVEYAVCHEQEVVPLFHVVEFGPDFKALMMEHSAYQTSDVGVAEEYQAAAEGSGKTAH